MSHSTESVLGRFARKWRDWREPDGHPGFATSVQPVRRPEKMPARSRERSLRCSMAGAIALGVILLSSSEPVLAQSMPAARRGFLFVRMHCAQCHAIDKVSESPLSAAPPLRTLRLKYPVADLQRPLADGIHPVMPRFRLEAHQVEAIMAYLKTLEP